jgi:hypothetical protein
MTAYVEGKIPSPQRRGSNSRPTSTQVKATWAYDVSLANQISTIIKPYQAPIPCKLQFNYSVINLETNFSSNNNNNTNYKHVKKIQLKRLELQQVDSLNMQNSRI